MKRLDLVFSPAPARTTRVRVGAGLFSRVARDLAEHPVDRWFVIADSRVTRLYGGKLERELHAAGVRSRRISFSRGEAAKTRETKAWIEDRLAALGAGRDCGIVALGGGVTGDLAGYVAATWHRGVPLVQLPTTMLAMVDAAIGGKNAVNLPAGKNLVGAIHQPEAVWADVDTLETLSDADYRDGIAELVKAGVIADAKLFRWLEKHVKPLTARRRATVIEAVTRGVTIKAKVVRSDEREAGRRAMLNFGHTIGHAIESVSGYRISHGRAISIGMAVEARIAVRRETLGAAQAERIENLLVRFGLPVRVPNGLAPANLLDATRRDKKARGGRARYALPVALGRMRPGGDPTCAVDPSDVRAVLAECLDAG